MAVRLLRADETIVVKDTELAGVANPDPDASYTIRKLDPKTHKEIVRRHTKFEQVRGVGKVERTDSRAASEDIFDYVLVSWVGVTDGDQPAECTRENKLGGLDLARRTALIDAADVNELARTEERRRESFRPPA